MGLQRIQVEDFMSPNVRDKTQTWKWGCCGRRVLLALMPACPTRDGWRATPERHKRMFQHDNSVVKVCFLLRYFHGLAVCSGGVSLGSPLSACETRTGSILVDRPLMSSPAG